MSDTSTPKRIPVGTINLRFAGDLVVPVLPDKQYTGLFKRYEAIFGHLANMEREQRVLNYLFLTGLMLTSYAKKTKEPTEKKILFDKKNEIFFAIANNRALRRKVAFKYLQSPNFRVTKYCSQCEKSNKEAGLSPHKWKFCKKCEIDRNFYNVLSMHHRFDNGSMTLFLSNDLIPKVLGLKIKSKGDIKKFDEEAKFEKYCYNVRNLDAVNLSSVLELHFKLLSGNLKFD